MSDQNNHPTPRRRRNPAKAVFIFFAGAGCLFFILGCCFIWNDHKFKQTALTATAVITNIDVSYDSDGDASHTVFVAFALNGYKYEGRLGYYVSGMHPGKEVQIFYNPDNPADFRGRGSIIFDIAMAVFGLLFMCVGLVPLGVFKKKRSRNEYLLANGRCTDVKIIEIYKNTRFAVNGSHPFVIRCRGMDDSGQTREFESENLWSDPSLRIDELRIRNLSVYTHKSKPGRYYVDIRKLQ